MIPKNLNDLAASSEQKNVLSSSISFSESLEILTVFYFINFSGLISYLWPIAS